MTPPKMYTAKLAERLEINPKFIYFTFELVEPNRLTFDAGQYVSIKVDEHGTRRPYSICSLPSREHGFEILVDLAPNGVGVKYLKNLQFGQEISLLAPMGMFTVPETVGDVPLIFIATGSGIAPFKSMIEHQLQEKKSTQKMTLYWGLRHVEDLFWEDDFERLAENFPNFQFHPVLSQAPSEWPLCRGHVTDCLMVHEFDPSAHYFLCGNTHMIEDVLKVFESKNLPKEQIHREKFY